MSSSGPFDSSSRDSAAVASRRMDEFAERYRQFFPRVFAYIYGRVHNVHTTEDLAADVFERAFQKAESLRNAEAFSTWLFTIARNIVISHGRKQGRETLMDPDVLKAIAPGRDNVEGDILMREEVTALSQVLRTCPQREQDIVALKFDAELTNAQIAEIMELSEANVRVILFRTLRKLRELMTAARKG